MTALLFFKNLSDDTRLKILLLITIEKELCVCEITQALALSQPKISRHIAQLRRDGLLTDRRSGKWIYYQLSPKLSPWQLQTLQQSYEVDPDYLLACLHRLELMGDRPERIQQCC